MLDALGRGHNLEAAERMRTILAEAGMTEVELTNWEVDQIRTWRAVAAHRLADAERMEARGPYPVEDEA
jgi:hypothetical protein